jgi:hypothetical protein
MNIQEVIDFGNKVEQYFNSNPPEPAIEENIEDWCVDEDDVVEFLGWKFLNESEVVITYYDKTIDVAETNSAKSEMTVKISDI